MNIASSTTRLWWPAIPDAVASIYWRRWRDWPETYRLMAGEYGVAVGDVGETEPTMEELTARLRVYDPDADEITFSDAFSEAWTWRSDVATDEPQFATFLGATALTYDWENFQIRFTAWVLWRMHVIELHDVLHRVTVFYSRRPA